jgi:hypothetical protein
MGSSARVFVSIAAGRSSGRPLRTFELVDTPPPQSCQEPGDAPAIVGAFFTFAFLSRLPLPPSAGRTDRERRRAVITQFFLQFKVLAPPRLFALVDFQIMYVRALSLSHTLSPSVSGEHEIVSLVLHPLAPSVFCCFSRLFFGS